MTSVYRNYTYNQDSGNRLSHNDESSDVLKKVAHYPVPDQDKIEFEHRGGGKDSESDIDKGDLESDLESELEVEEIEGQDVTDPNVGEDVDVEEDVEVEIKDETMDKMKKNYSYPDPADPHIQYKLYKKREFYFNKINERPDISSETPYSVIREYRNNTCGRAFMLHEHQGMLSNLINPDTPYSGILVFHGLGTGKTCVGVAIAENFKEMVQKYNTKIYILVPGPIIKESWRHHLLFCTGETYKKYHDKYTYIDDQEKARQEKQALAQALQYYKLMSYRSFYKRVLGEKIVDKKVTDGGRTKTTYRKTKEGDFERDIAIDRIYNLDNSIIIVDEAHNLTGNAYGAALRKIINNSKNLRVVLMTATPMKNLGSDIIELINFLRPKEYPIIRDKMLNSHKNHEMDFRPGGKEYFKKMVGGYVSHVRGSDPLTFAKRVDKGVVPAGLSFTNLIRCEMLEFQRVIYNTTVREFDDALDRASEAVANMAFPGMSKDRKSLSGYYGRDGLNVIKEQLKVNGAKLNKMIGDRFFDGKEDRDLLYITNDGKTVTGKIFKMPYLKNFSIKFYKALKKVKRLVAGKKGSKTAFVYSNLVKVGIEVFQEVLTQNGYLEYQEDPSNYQVSDDTICYYCGKTKAEHKQISRSKVMNRLTREIKMLTGGGRVKDLYQMGGDEEGEDDTVLVGEATDTESVDSTDSDGAYVSPTVHVSETSTEYNENVQEDIGKIPAHKFYPATFVSITGKSSEEKADMMSEDKKRILDKVFNTIENKEGKYIKLVLGSKVMNEGISMKHVGEVHILDVYFNLGKVDQVVGRAIRWCSHYKVMGEKNQFPHVNVYKYVVTLNKDGKDGLTSEEELYRKAEQKYILIKKIERSMKEVAIDCPLNIHGNIFGEEVKEHSGCDMHSDKQCPAICDYTTCQYKCDDPKLDFEYYDPGRNIYKIVRRKDVDYSTFTHNLAEAEIEQAKSKIKEMYITKPAHMLRDILDYVRKSYKEEKQELFDEFFVYKALDDMIPITENDFNNFKDTIIDKNNNQGYLIYRDTYYIFQPFNQNELVPLYYRSNKTDEVKYELSLYHYLKNLPEYKQKVKGSKRIKTVIDEANIYNFEDTLEYYDSRDEYKYVGIVDKEATRRKSKSAEEVKDVFKIREKLPKILDKKRGTGIPSLKGAVCSTSKSKDYLENVAKDLNADYKDEMTRVDICSSIEQEMLLKEKYATDKKGDKYTYIRIPSNHPRLPFPYNLEDRVRHIVTQIRNQAKFAVDIKTSSAKKKAGPEKGMPSYSITIANKPQLKEYTDFFKGLGGVETKKEWTVTIE
jgi:Type III restriction enzyme, res subunit